MGWDVDDVGEPLVVRTCGLEIALQQVGGAAMALVALRGHPKTLRGAFTYENLLSSSNAALEIVMIMV